MAMLNIQGTRVKVDDSFLQLSPEDQAKTVDEIAGHLGIKPGAQKEPINASSQTPAPAVDRMQQLSTALINADKAGDADAAKVLANEIIRLRGGAQTEPEQPEGPQSQSLRSQLSEITQHPARALYEQEPLWQKPLSAANDIADLAVNGITMGFGNKAAAALRSGITGEPYDKSFELMKGQTEAARDRSGYAGTAAEFGGAVATPMALAGKGVTLAGRFGTAGMEGAKGLLARAGLSGVEGAAYGGTSAAGNDGDIGYGMLTGGALGAAVPVATSVAGSVLKPIADAVGARINPEGFASQKVAERLSNSMTPQQAANRMAANPGTNLADVGGKSTRDLLRTATNIPGAAKDRVNAQLTLRQFGQGDRLKSAVADTFADPDGYLAAKDAISAEAQRLADPLYKRAYAQPVHYSKELEGILNTPAGKAALSHAEQLAANEQVPFQQLFVNIVDDGSAYARRVPDTRGWDYIKRAMDDMVDAQTDPITKKVTNEGRIIVALKNRMLGEVDKFNPDYAAARQAFAGQAQLDTAMETGRNVFKLSPEAMKREIAAMNPAQKAAARVGAAETLRGQIDAAGVTQNSVLRIFSKPSQMKNLQTMFETPQQFAEFRKAIFSEARKRSTYEAIKGNSSTASQLADMGEAGGLRETFDTAKTLATRGPVDAAIQWVGTRLKMLGGLTPEVANQISKQLMASSPQAKSTVIANLQQIAQSQASAVQKRQAIQAFVSRALAAGSGVAMAPSQSFGQDQRASWGR